jgi:hypothetical protein
MGAWSNGSGLGKNSPEFTPCGLLTPFPHFLSYVCNVLNISKQVMKKMKTLKTNLLSTSFIT